MTDCDRREIRLHMETRLSSLHARLETGELTPLACADENELASRISELTMTLALRKRDAGLASELREALKRMQDHDFGLCAQCGEGIPPARLKVHPTTRLCLECMRDLEEQRRSARAS